MKSKKIVLVVGALFIFSVLGIYSLSNSGFNKYRDDLLEIGHTEEEVLELEKEYTELKKKENSDVDEILKEYIEGIKRYKDNPPNKEVIPKFNDSNIK